MKIVVITGSTRGIGYGLAGSFLDLGCAVVISGRSRSTVEPARARLASEHDPERVLGHPCDVTDHRQVRALWAATQDHYGHIDYWINNAGTRPTPGKVWEQPAEERRAVVDVNLTGVIHGCAVALPHMLQQGFGAVYNMEGLGSDGRHIADLTLYGCTKYALAYLTEGLARDLEGSPVLVASLRPGMVVTDLITGAYEKTSPEWERAKRVFNILADPVETVTPWLAQQVLSNRENGAQIRWLTRRKLIWRFLSSPFHKRDLFEDE
jgi:NAD(P)-dependent dehydrogenase (short-subunit alcohol dehydrogenase family)